MGYVYSSRQVTCLDINGRIKKDTKKQAQGKMKGKRKEEVRTTRSIGSGRGGT